MSRTLRRAGIVVLIAGVEIEVPGDMPGPAVELCRTGELVRVGTGLELEDRSHRRRRRFVGHPPVEDVDHTANGVGAPQDSGRTAHDLDPLGGQRVHRHCVIGTDGGDIAGVETVFQDPDPIRAETPNHRPTRTLAVGAGRDAWLLCQGFAEGRLLAQKEILTGEHIDRLRDLTEPARHARGGDGDAVGMDELVESEGQWGCAIRGRRDPRDHSPEPRARNADQKLTGLQSGE